MTTYARDKNLKEILDEFPLEDREHYLTERKAKLLLC
jgi:hypothetical protein